MLSAGSSTRAGKKKVQRCKDFNFQVVCGRCQPVDQGHLAERTTSKDLILPQRVLLKQLCTECHKYLSVRPVFTGRGCPKGCCDTKLVPSLFNGVAEVFIFPCINNFTGCKELLSFGQAKEHEKICPFKKRLKCPFCKTKYDGDVLLYHLRSVHKNLIVKNGEFTFSMVGERQYLIAIKERHIFCVAIHVTKNATVIFNILLTQKESTLKSFSIKILEDFSWKELIPQCELNTDPNYFPLINDAFYKTFFEFENDRFLSYKNYVVVQNSIWQRFSNRACDSWLCKVELKESLAKSNFTIGAVATFNTLYNPDILTKLDGDSLKSLLLKHKDKFQCCNRCKKFVQPELYFCPSYHLACKNCIYKKCVQCNCFVLWSNKTKFDQITLSCGFKNCNERPHIFEYFGHTQNCKFRQYLCPDPKCSFVGPYSPFIRHWHLIDICRTSNIKLDFAEQKFWFLPTKDLVIINFTSFDPGSKILRIMEYSGNLTPNYQFVFYCSNSSVSYDSVRKGTYSGLSFIFSSNVPNTIEVRIVSEGIQQI